MKGNISVVSGFFVCLCYSRWANYPTLEKPGAQNILCEIQGKQYELSDHCKSIKEMKKKGDDIKKIDWNTSFNERLYILIT